MSDEIYITGNDVANFKSDWYDFVEIKPFNDPVYYVGEKYTATFLFQNKLTYNVTIVLDKTSSSEIKLASDQISVSQGVKQEIKIFFNPNSSGEKILNLYVHIPRGGACLLLEKKFQVKAKVIAVEGQIEKSLPIAMKLGQKAETIFLFTNKGNQTVTGVSIDIKQIEST